MKDLGAAIWETCKETVEPLFDHFVVKSILAIFSVSLGWLFGVEFFNFINLIIALVIIDAITGVWAAREAGETISSKRFAKTAPKLLRYLFFIAAAHLLAETIQLELYIENAVIIFIATTEFISIAENLGKAGMPIPKKLLNKVEQLRNGQ